MVETYRCAGKIHAAFYGFDTSRFFKSMLSGLLIGSENVEIEAIIRNDNSSDAEHAHAIKSVDKDRMCDGFLESNRDWDGPNPWLALSHIAGPLNISEEMDKSMTRSTLALLLSRNITQSMGKNVKGEIRKTYPSGKQYLSFPETKKDRAANGRRGYLESGEKVWPIVN